MFLTDPPKSGAVKIWNAISGLRATCRERRGKTMLLISSLLPAGVTTAYRKAVCDSGGIAANLN